jgi:tetrahydromethanopterin S-methyltransferase subunit D
MASGSTGILSGGLLGGLLGGSGGGIFDILQKVPNVMNELNKTGAFSNATNKSVIQNGAVQITFEGKQDPDTIAAAENKLGPALIRAILAGVGSI